MFLVVVRNRISGRNLDVPAGTHEETLMKKPGFWKLTLV
jgi:hypothetical protein